MVLGFHLEEDDGDADDPLPPRGICDGLLLVEDNLPAAMVVGCYLV